MTHVEAVPNMGLFLTMYSVFLRSHLNGLVCLCGNTGNSSEGDLSALVFPIRCFRQTSKRTIHGLSGEKPRLQGHPGIVGMIDGAVSSW